MGVNAVNGQDFAALSVAAAKSTSAPQIRTYKAAPSTANQRVPQEQSEGQEVQTARTLTESAGPAATHATMRMDEESNRVVVQIYDEHDRLIKQIPPEDLLEIAERFRELQGVIFDEQT